MRYCAVIALIFLFSCANSQNSDADECTCVIYYLCRQNDRTIITDGEGLINERGQPKCKSGDVCCKFGNETSAAIIPTKPPTVPPRIPTVKPEEVKCGVRNPDGVGFKEVANAVNSETEFGEFPWMVGILRSTGTYRCGGSLIHPSVVLTAAHCVVKNEKYIVVAGEWDSSSTAEVYKHQKRDVSSKIIHENYTPGIYYNDVALLILDTPVELAPHINLACLPSANTVDDTSRCFATGWGKDQFGEEGKFPPILKEIELPMVPRATCQENLRTTRLGKFFELHRSFVCAGGEGKDTCVGDGGGPLVCPIPGEDDRYQQIGIVSWGLECNDKNVPGVYANVAYLRSWIDQKMKANSYDVNGYQY